MGDSGLRQSRVQWISAEDAYDTTRTARMTRAGPAAGGGGTIPRTTGARRGSSTGGAARRKHARWSRDSSPEDDGGAGRPLRGRGDRNGREDYCTLSHRVLAHQYAVSHHISVLVNVLLQYQPLQPIHYSCCFYAVRLIAWIIWRQLLDIDDGASRRRLFPKQPFSSSPFSTRTKTSGRSKGPNGLSIHRPRPTQMGSGFGLFYPSSYGVASPRALYLVETGGPMGDVEFEI